LVSTEKDADTKQIIDLSLKIEGNPRHISVHAAGVVIAPGPLDEYVPLQFDPKGGKVITQYDMYAVGEDGVGLTKFDFLGLRNLAILSSAINLVEQTLDQKIDIETIPLNDPKTFAMLARGETIGLFQLNGAGMTRWLKELRPTTIHDINAMVALYRPGPMQFIPEYIERKHNPKLIKYLDPSLETILKQSYGVLVYQDDLLIMAHDLAGYSWGEVDKFRKAVGKKIPELMAEQREKFIKGCMEHSKWSKEKATEIWAWLEPFAAYGFNKAHSASYGRVAYQTAYLKANFPAEYMTAVLSAESGNTETVTETISESKRMGIPVLPPDINESYGDFTVIKDDAGDKIRFGLYTIKNLGTEISDVIVAERKAKGQYTSIANFLERVKHRNLNKKSLESLIKAGALDSLNEERGKLLYNLDNLLAFHQETMKTGDNQSSLFGLMADTSSIPQLKLRECLPVATAERLAWERELLGVYVSGHPLDVYKDKFLNSEHTIKKARETEDGKPIVAAGLLEEVKPILTKKGEQMAFIKITDYTGTIESVVFTKIYREFKELIQPERCIAVKGRISHRNGEPSIVIDAIKAL
jgi:DNA polymerase-3 subunit alpha